MRLLGLAVLGAVALAGCARLPAYEAKSVAPTELEVAREQVRGYARTHCGRCHMASLPTALPRALAIYNLDADRWSSTLTAAQLRNGFPRRLNPQLDDEGKRQLQVFIAGELALRETPPAAGAADLDARIQRIENGLLAPVVIQGQAIRPMKLADRMEFFKTPGVSVAFINGGRIEWARAYGVREAGTRDAVTVDTLFEAGSISKPVTAIAALRLVEAGRLDLDEDVNRKLTSWKVPENEFTRERKVTLRELLSHRAGVNVPSFIGYFPGAPFPTLVQVLDGKPPANTPAIRVVSRPDERFQYSGGGYTIVQQLLVDVEKKPFPDLMSELVFEPLGLKHSTFHQAPFNDRIASMGHDARGAIPAGKWRAFPELAAAGMWTTPSDLARLLIDVQRAQAGDTDRLLGFFVEGDGRSRRFHHAGSTLEFNSYLVAYTQTGQGVVIMTNALRADRLISELLRSIAHEYGWSEFQPKEKSVASIDSRVFADYAGSYQFDFSADFVLTVRSRDGKLIMELKQPTSTSTAELHSESETRFFRTDADVEVTFVRDASGRVTHLVFRQEGQDLRADRVD
jgi:CubicO group peptidase (beta-lactamase class C family)